jgi:hypothetical protein
MSSSAFIRLQQRHHLHAATMLLFFTYDENYRAIASVFAERHKTEG